MRRILIQFLLPFLMCILPLLAGFLVAVAIPRLAMSFYLEYLFQENSYLDWLILGSGSILFLLQTGLTWKALRWQGHDFDHNPDRWLKSLAQTAEWFPILGLLSTVAGILQTFGRIGSDSLDLGTSAIIASYAPAITGTGSGLFMAFLNLMPFWVVQFGRDLIMTLGGNRVVPEERTS